MQQRYEIARAAFVDIGDGKRGYYAVPAGPAPFPAVLVFQEAFGVNGYVRSEVERLASRGYAAIAPDLFDGKTLSYDDMERVYANLASLTDDGLLAYVQRAMRFLDGQADVGRAGYGAVGFCMGGRLAFLTAVSFPDRIAAAASFYGGSIAPPERARFAPLVDRVPELRAELLLVYGADDASITPQEHGRLAEALSTHKKRYCLCVFPGAGHGFASRDRVPAYRPEQAEAAWSETLALFERTLR